MKNLTKLFGIIALAAVMILALAGCSGKKNSGGGSTTSGGSSDATAPEGFVRINGGTFTMGSPANEGGRDSGEVQHKVTVSSFYMGKYEVTQKEWTEIMDKNPSIFKGDNLPVAYVSWFRAIEYCNKRSEKEGLTPAYTITVSAGDKRTVTWDRKANGYHLPTEAQWEYACRAGTTTAWHSGDTSENLSDYAWYGRMSSNQPPHEPGKKLPNAWGLYDMHGNMKEWCWDWAAWDYYRNSPRKDPAGPSSGAPTGFVRVLRGGHYSSSASAVRSAYRSSSSPGSPDMECGFRLALPAQ